MTPWALQADIMNGTDPSAQDVATAAEPVHPAQGESVSLQSAGDGLADRIVHLAGRRPNGIPVVGVYETMPEPGYDYQSWMLAEVQDLQKAVVSKVSTRAPVMTADTAPAGRGRSVRLGGREILRGRLVHHRARRVHRPHRAERRGQDHLLRVILGLQPVTRGSVLIDGAPRAARDASIGYVPQKLAIEPDMPLRVRDVVSLGIDGHKFGIRLPSRARRELVDDMLTAVGAQRYADARVGELSGGEQQRVMIAHALISKPRLLLLDEPLANLDISSEQGIVSVLARLARAERIAVLLSAHDMNPLMPVMDRIVYVAGGRVAVGPHRRGGSARGPVPPVRPARRRDPGARADPGGGRPGRRDRRRWTRRRGRARVVR